MLIAAPRGGDAQTVHLLEAGPRTIAWGHCFHETPPVLRIRSGEIIEVTPMITSTPQRLEAARVAPDEIPQALRDIVDNVTDRGPGGHILTGPVYVEGAEPGDVLEVRVLTVELPHPLRLQRLQRLHPRELPRTTHAHLPLRHGEDGVGVPARDRDPFAALLRQHGRRAAARRRAAATLRRCTRWTCASRSWWMASWAYTR